MEKNKITKAILGRLPVYLDLLTRLDEDNVVYISATKVAKTLSFGEVQVRKDLNAVCGKGKPKLGYRVKDLIASIEGCLGYKQCTAAVLVGAGKLGRALLEYDGFEKFGVRIVAAFDCQDCVLKIHKNLEILPMSQFDDFCRSNNVRMGIITVGEGSAQIVCDRMVESGIDAIWNFAPCKLSVPDGVLFLQENLALSLAYLNSKLLNKRGEYEE